MMSSKRTRRQTVAAAAALIAAAVAVAGCSGNGSAKTTAAGTGGTYPSRPFIAYLSGATSADPFWASVQKGAEAAAADQDVNLDWVVPGGSSVSATTTRTALQAAIARHPAGLVVDDAFPTDLDPLIKQETSSGTAVLIANGGVSSVGPDNAIGFVGQTDYNGGLAAGTAMANAGVTKAICLNVPGFPIAEQRCAGFTKTFAAGGRSVVNVDIPLSQIFDSTAVERAIEGSLTAHKDVNGVMALGIIEWDPLYAALQQMSLTDKVKIASFDLSTNELRSIQAGTTLFSIDQQPYLEGYYGVMVMAQYLRYGLLPPSGGIATGPVLITKANAAATLKYNAIGVRGAS
jgi:simple sugar transport system substrate-binding protein